jgi:HEAT repeats
MRQMECHMTTDTDTDIVILRFVERSPTPVSWYNARYLDVGAYGTPVAAFRALHERGLLEEIPAQPHNRYQLSETGKEKLHAHRQELMKRLDALTQGKLSPDDALDAIHTFGEELFEPARPALEALLTSADPRLRTAALRVLVGRWRHADEKYWDTARSFLQSDPAVECRIAGATMLGMMGLLGTPQQAERTLAVLAPVVRNDEDSVVRQAAYSAMRAIVLHDPQEQIKWASKPLEQLPQVDWQLVDRYASHTTS